MGQKSAKRSEISARSEPLKACSEAGGEAIVSSLRGGVQMLMLQDPSTLSTEAMQVQQVSE